MRLHVHPRCAVKVLRALDGQFLHFIYDFTSAVVSFKWEPFCVFVRQHASHGLHHLPAHIIFGGYKLYTGGLAVFFFFDQFEYNGISFHVFAVNFSEASKIKQIMGDCAAPISQRLSVYSSWSSRWFMK